ncbi:MAG: VOC family protein [Actinomycetota bacterium]|nr:VOC family protein [Actinomycetota bacterium]
MDQLYVGSVVIDVNDLPEMLSFWAGVLGYEHEHRGDDWVKLVDPNEKGVTVSLQKVPEPRTGKNRLHIDLYAGDRGAEVDRIVGMGAEVVREPGPDEDFVVLADPEGNLFCVIDQSDTG